MDQEIQFPEEFKRNAVQLLLLGAKSMDKIEEQFEIPAGLLPVWVQELKPDDAHAESRPAWEVNRE